MRLPASQATEPDHPILAVYDKAYYEELRPSPERRRELAAYHRWLGPYPHPPAKIAAISIAEGKQARDRAFAELYELRPPVRLDEPEQREWSEGFGAAIPDDDTREALDLWPAVMKKPLFVYFVQAAEGGPVKIGRARDPWHRLRELQVGNASMLVLRSVVLATPSLEESLHRKWNAALVRGEWFGEGYEEVILASAHHACLEQLVRWGWGHSPDLLALEARELFEVQA